EYPPFSPPVPPENANIYFFDTFTDVTEFNQRWVHSSIKNEDGNNKYTGSFKIGELHIQGNWAGDNHLLVPEKAQHYGIAAKMIKPVYFEDEDILV
ncbi:hypothetical protein, partial [Salmonella sp. s51228]|uniref:hypothetical protein n=1 Tax=Salmonella sp. s51228 TaxID=3159652 RepID=UPI00397ED50E